MTVCSNRKQSGDGENRPPPEPAVTPEALNFAKGRLWEVPFEMTSMLGSLPFPRIVVEETQTTPLYHIAGNMRSTMRGCQLSCTLSGEGIFRIGKQEIRLTPGMAFLQCHNDRRNAYRYPADGREPWRFLWIAFSSKAAENIARAVNREYGYIFRLPLDSGIVKKLKNYEHYNGRLQVITPLEGATIFMDVITRLANLESRREETVSSELIRLAHEYIYAHLEDDIDIRAIAAHLGISREHLARVFKQQLGESPSSYLHRKKMMRACKLLLETNLTVSEVGDKLGYASGAAFIRTFKQHLQMTPGQLRAAGWLPPGVF
jgi:AraC-like DNA-binding protein